MYRLSLIISEVYNKYLPLAEKGGVSLNLDFSDTTKTVTDPEAIKTDLDKHLSSILGLSERGEITISVEQDAIIITDSNTILSKPICALLSKGRVSVSSRVGFGTTVHISLLPPEPTSDTESPTKLPETTKPAAKLPSSKTTTPAKTTRATKSKVSKNSKPTSKSKSKPTREQRKLASAAKKADRQIQKLRKTQPTAAKSPKTKPTKTKAKANAKIKSKTKSPKPKTAKKTHKRIIELS